MAEYLELAKQYVQPGQIFQVGVIVRAVAVLLDVALFVQFTGAANSASGSLEDNLKHLYAWFSNFGRLGYDVASLPIIALWAYALLVEGAVDFSTSTVQLAAYGVGILSVVGAVFSLFLAGGYLTSFGVADTVGTITLTLQGVIPALAQLIPAAGFAWLAWDSNVELEEDFEEDAELFA